MVTTGDVSLDVEDGHCPDEWPHIEDISSDKLKYSVHLALEPMVRTYTQTGIIFHQTLAMKFLTKFPIRSNKGTGQGGWNLNRWMMAVP